jgi:hypothetical protein
MVVLTGEERWFCLPEVGDDWNGLCWAAAYSWASVREQIKMAIGPGGTDEMVGPVYRLWAKIGK